MKKIKLKGYAVVTKDNWPCVDINEDTMEAIHTAIFFDKDSKVAVTRAMEWKRKAFCNLDPDSPEYEAIKIKAVTLTIN